MRSRRHIPNVQRRRSEMSPRLDGMLRGEFGGAAQQQVLLGRKVIATRRELDKATKQLKAAPSDLPRTANTGTLEISQQRLLLDRLDMDSETDERQSWKPHTALRFDVEDAAIVCANRHQVESWKGQLEFARLLEDVLEVAIVYPYEDGLEVFINPDRLGGLLRELRLNVAHDDLVTSVEALRRQSSEARHELEALLLISERPLFESADFLLTAIREHESAVEYFATEGLGLD